MHVNITRVGDIGHIPHIPQQPSILQARKPASRVNNHTTGPVAIKRQFAYEGRWKELKTRVVSQSALFSEPQIVEPVLARSLSHFLNSMHGNEKGYTVVGIRPEAHIKSDYVPIGIYPYPREAVLYDAIIPLEMPTRDDLVALVQTRIYREGVEALNLLCEGSLRIPFITDPREMRFARGPRQEGYIEEVARSGSVPRHKFSDITGLPDLRSIYRGKMIRALPNSINMSIDTLPHEFLEVLKKATERSSFIGIAAGEKVSVAENGYASVTDPTATNSGIVDTALSVKLGENYFWALLQSPRLHEAIMLHNYSPDPAEFPTFAGRFSYTETPDLIKMGLEEYAKWVLGGRQSFSSEMNLVHIANLETVRF